jgi:glutamate synthase (NADPH/NADH) large chain
MTFSNSLARSGETYNPYHSEHDACAIVAAIRKGDSATHGNVKRVLNALSKMGHRSGDVNGEGDGCGLLTDIPRLLWQDALQGIGKPGWLAQDQRFFVGHLQLAASARHEEEPVVARIEVLAEQAGLAILISRPGLTRARELGKLARQQEPCFWQIAGLVESGQLAELDRILFRLGLQIETETPTHVASLSTHSVVYKVRGSVETLYHYYPELRNTRFTSRITLGHTRYSTNTTTAFERVQPFLHLGHNGEINTIARLREQAQMLGTKLVDGGSDSQDLDRTLGTLLHDYQFSLIEALEILFPPILSEVERLPTRIRQAYRHYRSAFGPFAQGPAGLITRSGSMAAFSVDALGLRPLWFGNTDKEYYFSSEKGVYFLDSLIDDPRPLSPGEKVAVRICPDNNVEVLEYRDIQGEVAKGWRRRYPAMLEHEQRKTREPAAVPLESSQDDSLAQRALVAFGWGRSDQAWVKAVADLGYDPIGSLGYDGPLAALSNERKNLADYFKESVAVVTNPAIDREREQEHFSTEAVIGARPGLHAQAADCESPLILKGPILLDGQAAQTLEQPDALAAEHGTLLLSTLRERAGQTAATFELVHNPTQSLPDRLDQLSEDIIASVRAGASIIILDDRAAFSAGQGWIDPILALAVVDRALRATDTSEGALEISLRRRTGLILRSAAIRNLHDLIMALGLGADAVAPYALLDLAAGGGSPASPDETSARLSRTLQGLLAGLEKVASTMGIHELRGYGRLFASIGLSAALAAALGTKNFAGSETVGVTWERLECDTADRIGIAAGAQRANLARIHHFYPKVWKSGLQVAMKAAEPDHFEIKAESTAERNPVTLRHILDLNLAKGSPIDAATVETGITGHAFPFVISSMSFGSQSETAFRAYAEGAKRLNIISLSGEGGEILDMMGAYPHHRGQQIASGRFGVDINLLNASNLLEIKVGQGAKPGEGGHLPGKKVSQKVAAARHARPGVDLISPSNNHDIYSIEDLAQFIEELKTANPRARIIVKVPVVPGIGIIAVGIAKAGADVINLTGYDGGTGAARQHSLRYVGLPSEIGVSEAHRELALAGLRDRVEIWCDGGVRTAADTVKMICLGANRVGFGTLAMVAIGCTICRACQTDTCHVGIATQVETQQQALAHGLKKFAPLELDRSIQGLMSLFGALGRELARLTAELGFWRTQDMVGRTDLLRQVSHHDALDLAELLQPAIDTEPEGEPVRQLQLSTGTQLSRLPLRRPRNHLTTVISNMVMESVAAGETHIRFEDDKISPVDRSLGTHLSGALTRHRKDWDWEPGHGGVGGLPAPWYKPRTEKSRRRRRQRRLAAYGQAGTEEQAKDERQLFPAAAGLRFYASSVPGNGLGAYAADPMSITVEGGAQDGVGKGMHGGRIQILKGINHDGIRVDGSVGKGLAYGAIGGRIIVQGNADSRACIRLSGADVIIGGQIQLPVRDEQGYLGARANVKGFLCEYMTAGRVLVLGDPGPWIGAGMTGGVLYLRLQPELGFDREAIRRRIAQGAQLKIADLDDDDLANLRELLTEYAAALEESYQEDEAQRVLDLGSRGLDQFVRLTPDHLQMDQTVSTE